MRRTLIGTCALALILYVAAPCSAGVITASGAGSTIATAEDLTGLYPSEIQGVMNGDPNDVNIFKILILDSWNFSALTVDAGAHGIQDTVLSLFDSSGTGIYLNDDISGSSFFSCLPSQGLSNPCSTVRGTLLAGVYYLAISQGANYPLDSLGNEIFTGSSTDLLTADPSAGVLASWDGGSFTSPDGDSVNYDIELTGTVPEPATWLLTAGAVLMLGRLRRRR